MASIIETGEHEAIKLEWLHSEQILQLDKHGKALTERNGGYADLLLEIRAGVISFLKILNESYPLKSKNNKKISK